MSENPAPEAEPPKHIVTTQLGHSLAWHTWTVLSLIVTAILFWLNFSEYAIGGEIGQSPKSSANIIGALQLGIKAHELLIVASLLKIARQIIIGNLFDGGILLGLLGAEHAVSSLSFIFTGEFKQSLLFGLKSIFRTDSQPIHRRILWLAIFMFWACVLSALAGPASGVLMIPRVDWKFAGERRYTRSRYNTNPNILIADKGSLDVFGLGSQISGLKFWEYYLENSAWNVSRAGANEMQHSYADGGSVMYVNTTGSYGRLVDEDWNGGTRITCAMQTGSEDVQDQTWGRFPTPMNETLKGWSAVKSTINLVALDAAVTCRARQKIPCSKNATLSGNVDDPDWCYMSVGYSASSGVLRTSRNLILTTDFDGYSPRVWVTEGPKITANSHYSDSLEVVLESQPPRVNAIYRDDNIFNLTVCSFSATLVAGIGTALGVHFKSEKIEYFNYSLSSDGTHAPPRQLLFHENWLDNAYALRREDNFETSPGDTLISRFSFPARPRTVPPLDANMLGVFGNTTRKAGGSTAESEALPAEVTVGGALTYIISWVPNTNSQFSMEFDEIPPQFIDGLGPLKEWPTEYIFRVYQEGYLFRLSSRTGYLGVIVLGLHSLTAIIASLWQLIVTRRVFLGWNNTPEYIMLGAGSPSLAPAYPNTCAGIKTKGVLSGIVMLKETSSGFDGPSFAEARFRPVKESDNANVAVGIAGTPHLEIVTGDPTDLARIGKVDVNDTSKMYGFSGLVGGGGKVKIM
ncbi:hypothetical protein Q9L58_008526 [Maublancomyces gigas]|uniref:Uncharacterized protein n=1 Tax=Discina gigas TaxID=1032678 RepID=A0ABR3G9I1_9PEZI